MSLRNTFRNLATDMVQTTFKDLAQQATVQRETSVRVEDTGEIVPAMSSTTVFGLFMDYQARQDDLRAVPAASMVGYIPAQSIAEIEENDKVVVNRRVHLVVRADLDAASAMHVVYLRRQ